ncbi:RNA 3'-terminal phosphate cyclase [Candidatus Woesearchaeota archaeon]|nr:RNA 3'-terminal phosphate cyclase [Candidatus Woesearchaeota archaeon]
MIKIDGSYEEGGGQIIRTALALSVITKKPFCAKKIRKKRKNPGLKNQHMYAVDAASKLSNAKYTGKRQGSTKLEFYPRAWDIKNLNVDIQTAGSTTLLLQSIIFPCMFGGRIVTIRLKGGTDTKWAMPVDYLANVFLPHLMDYAEIDFNLKKRGYYPKGGGKIKLKLRPKFHLRDYAAFSDFHRDLIKAGKKINLLKRQKLVEIRGVSHASKDLLRSNVSDRQAKAARFFLRQFDVPIKIRIEYADTLSTGSGITLWAVFSKADEFEKSKNIIAADSLGEKGKRSEIVGQEAAKRLISLIKSEAPVDNYLGDQILPMMGLFPGSKIKVPEITGHMKSNIYVIEKFLDVEFEIKENTISCHQK